MNQFQCQECGKLFRTVKAAEQAALDGCPKCGGVDIDIAPHQSPGAKPSGIATPRSTDR